MDVVYCCTAKVISAGVLRVYWGESLSSSLAVQRVAPNGVMCAYCFVLFFEYDGSIQV